MQSQLLNWPDHIPRTPPEDRERTKKFETKFSKTQRDLRKEMERMDVEEWRLDHITGSGGDPGVVVRWIDDGQHYALGADQFETKSSNAREAYLWIQETRKRAKRQVQTTADNFAAARLPAGDGEAADVPEDGKEPHEVLGVDPDANQNEINEAFREKARQHKGDSERFGRLKEAYQAMGG